MPYSQIKNADGEDVKEDRVDEGASGISTDSMSTDSVIVASPCSGHGFKFASVLGEILSDLALDSDTKHDIKLFRL